MTQNYSQIYFDGPHYFYGNLIALICLVIQLFAIVGLRILLKRMNSKRSKMTPDQKEEAIAKFGELDLVGDRHPEFRYVL